MYRSPYRVGLFFLIALGTNGCFRSTLEKQSSEGNLADAACDSRHAITFPFSLLIPSGIRIGYDMRNYIASREFGMFDSSRQPEIVFDEIYYQAIEYTHGDLPSALLAAAFGSIEHEYIPFDLFGKELDFPLTNESHARFIVRWSHLPEHLYHIPEGDRDKIQHFFASAWLKSTLGMDWLVKLAGKGVEVGESLLLIGGFEDPRDLHANEDGIRFGTEAEGNINLSPSAALTPNP
jgi:hypothetical protein